MAEEKPKLEYQGIWERMKAVEAYVSAYQQQAREELQSLCEAVGGTAEVAVKVVNDVNYPEWFTEDIEELAQDLQGCEGFLDHIDKWDESLYW